MKRILFCINLLLSIYASAQPDYRQAAAQKADQVEAQVIAWRRDIHEHPELSNREFRTAALVAKELRASGLEVREKIAVTGVVGILKGGKPGPVVALRADMDALPITERTTLPFASRVKAQYNGQEAGVMHACGHDAHTAILLGVAKVLASVQQDIPGTIVFIFQPAEESAPKGEEGGAKLMIRQGVLDNPKPEVIFGLHEAAEIPVGKIGYKPAGFMASACDMKITVKGRSSHGAMPWLSVDPVVVSAQIITALQTIVSRNLDISQNAGAVTIGTINGGTRFNIVPEQVEMTGTVRALSPDDEQMMYEKVRQIATKTAEAFGATAEVEIPYNVRYPVTFNDTALSRRMLPSFQRTAGAENVILIPAQTISEDFSFYQEKIPGIFFRLGGMPAGKDPKTVAGHHTPDFYIDEGGFKLGVNALVNLALDYLEGR